MLQPLKPASQPEALPVIQANHTTGWSQGKMKVRIMEFTADGKAAFLSDRKTWDAVLRNLQTLPSRYKGFP
jgi:hypothetical protein